MASDRRPGVLLSGYYGAGNLGDDLLLAISVTELRSIIPGARFFVRDHGDVKSLRTLGPDVVFTGIEAILADRRHSKIRRAARYFSALVGILRQCRWLVFGGGTVFHEHGTLSSLLLQWATCCLARLHGVRIAALGVGLSDLRTESGRWLVRRIIGMSSLFLVRDEAALRQCIGTKARLTGDLVFSCAALTNLQPNHRAADGVTIALTISPFALDSRAEESAIAALNDAVRLWMSHGHRVVFLVFLRAGVTAGDEAMFARIADRLGPQPMIETRRPSAEPEAIAATFRDIDVICGMRFHGLVLAAMSGLPFVGLAHDNKISEICRSFRMTCLDAGAFTGAELAAAVEAALGRRPDIRLLEQTVAAARTNIAAFAALNT